MYLRTVTPCASLPLDGFSFHEPGADRRDERFSLLHGPCRIFKTYRVDAVIG